MNDEFDNTKYLWEKGYLGPSFHFNDDVSSFKSTGVWKDMTNGHGFFVLQNSVLLSDFLSEPISIGSTEVLDFHYSFITVCTLLSSLVETW